MRCASHEIRVVTDCKKDSLLYTLSGGVSISDVSRLYRHPTTKLMYMP
jgi:hypothetical protein